MKYISAAILIFASTSSAWLLPQADTAEPNTQGISSDALSNYPQGTDLNSLNGTWYMTGVTKNAWDAYQTLSEKFNIQVECTQFNVNTTSNTTLDVLSSAFLNQTTLNFGINATVAGSLILQPPDQKTNVSNHELLWEAYTSQVFVNKALWNKFIQHDQPNANNNSTPPGSTPVPGTKPIEATIYTQLIDTTAQPGTNSSTNFDAIFLWGSHAKTLDNSDNNQHSRRDDDHDDIYGVLLTKNATVSPDIFNRTIGLLPQTAVFNNAQLVQLNDTCSSSTGQQGQGQDQQGQDQQGQQGQGQQGQQPDQQGQGQQGQPDQQQPGQQQPDQQQPGQQQPDQQQPGQQQPDQQQPSQQQQDSQPFLGH